MPPRTAPRPQPGADPRPGRVRALIFDMDGVLVDSEPLWRRAEIEIFGQVGLSLSEKDCLQTQGMRIDEVVAWWFDRAPWPNPPPEDVACAIVERVAELIRREGTALPGAQLALEAALEGVRERGWRLALASSSSKFLITTVLDHLGWSQVFECTHSAEDEAFGKPHPAVYLSTARTLGVLPGDCLAIEDSVHGVQSAIAAGMRCIAISPLGKSRDPGLETAHVLLESLARLPEALEKWEESDAPDG